MFSMYMKTLAEAIFRRGKMNFGWSLYVFFLVVRVSIPRVNSLAPCSTLRHLIIQQRFCLYSQCSHLNL